MPASKKSTIKTAAHRKKSRRLQLANARKQRKIHQNVANITEISESAPAKQHVTFPRNDCVPSSSSQSGGSDSSLAETSRSKLKRDTYKDMAPSSSKRVSVDDTDSGHTQQEHRGIVDLPELGEIIKMLCCPQCKNTSLVLNTGSKNTQGLAVHAEVYCSCCEEVVTGRYLASRSNDGDKSFAINKQFVNSALVCGMDVTSLNTFCENMNLQGLHSSYNISQQSE